MSGVNKVILVGNLGRDPEVKVLPNGTQITKLALATSEKWTDKNTGQKQEKTEWHQVQFFGKQAELAAQYLSKGSKIYVEGSIHTRKYQDQSGQDKYVTEIKGQHMTFLGGNQQQAQPQQQYNQAPQPQQQYNQAPQQQAPQQQPPQQQAMPVNDFSDDIPF